MTNKAWKPNSSTIDEWNAPAATVYSEDSILSGDTQVTPECDFEAASDSVPLYSRNNRLREKQVPPAPVSTATASVSSPSKSRNACASAEAVGASMALRTSGRLIVTTKA